MTQHGLFQSVPPVYTEYVGRHALSLERGWQQALDLEVVTT